MTKSVEPVDVTVPQIAERRGRHRVAAVVHGRRVWSRSPLWAGSPIRLLCGLAFVLDQEP